VFHDETLPAQRVGEAPGKLRIVFDQQNADDYLLGSNRWSLADTPSQAIPGHTANFQVAASLAPA